MHSIVKNSLSAMIVSSSLCGVAAIADTHITCKSNDHRYASCKLDRPGHVRLVKQLSDSKCQQGKTWDYDRRAIWVDDGCAAKFAVSYNESYEGDTDVGKALGILAGAVIVGAIANEIDKHDKYNDPDYHGGRHSSYVPSWMVGKFRGYNEQYDAEVVLKIESDGQATARTRGTKLRGFVNNEELHIGTTVFDITRSTNGFYTNQHGNRANEVKYHRIN